MVLRISHSSYEAIELTPNIWCPHCDLVWWPEELRHVDTCKCGERTLDWNDVWDWISEGKLFVGSRETLCRTGMMFK